LVCWVWKAADSIREAARYPSSLAHIGRSHHLFSVRGPVVLAGLSSLAAQTGRSKTFYMLEGIKQHIDDLEDLYLAEQRLLDVHAGRSKTHSLDDVERSLGLAD
jgi:RHH-type rel operon transcriptional repressor/antitoxin RelB